MKYIITDANGVVLDCCQDYVDGAIEITDEQARVFRTVTRHDLYKLVDGDLVLNDALLATIAQKKALAEKKRELADLEVQMARALLWLIKLLIAKGTIAAADVPQPLRDLRTRVEALQSELGG